MLAMVLASLITGYGYPGPESRADYTMEAALLPDSHAVLGSTVIKFTSGVDFPVDTLWLHLYPNAYRDVDTPFGRDLEAVGRYGFRSASMEDRGWIELSGWTVDDAPVNVEVDHCLGYIPLDAPLPPGGTAVLKGDFRIHVPVFWSRMGRSGETYQITQWYPKMCALDSSGWHLGRYRWRGEFFSDFGDYEVCITVPSEFVTAATGCVAETRFSGDSTSRTDRWTASMVHDFVWSASPDYTVRRHTFRYPSRMGSDSVRVHLVLLDDGPEHWADVPAVIDSTLLYYGQWYGPYAWDDLWVVEPAVLMAGGMEYPQFVFSAAEIPMTRALEMVTAHEIGHQWFYGMLASDEVNEAWLDEGINTFSELRYMQRRHGLFGNMTTTPEWILDVSDQDMNLLTYVSGASGCEKMPVLSDATSAGDGSHSTGFTYYAKPALFLSMLRDQAGEEAFDRAMSLYFQRFRFHHPHTGDLQAIFAEVTGRSWEAEFDYWLRGRGSSDIIAEPPRIQGDSTVVSLSGQVPHPLDVPVLATDGEDSLWTRIHLDSGRTGSLTLPGSWTEVVADPFAVIPDRAPWNNSWPVRTRLRPLLVPFPRPTHNSIWLLPVPTRAAGTWGAGLLCMSTPVPSYMDGPYTWTGRLSVPLGDDGYSYWGTYLHMPFHRGLRRSLYGSLAISRGYGTGEAAAGLSYHATGRVPADPRFSLSLGTRLSSVEDTGVYGAQNVEEGHGLELLAGISASDRSYRLSWKWQLAGLVSPGWNDGPFCRADVTLDLETRFFGDVVARTRLYLGRVSGDAPRQVLLRPGGGLFAGGIIGSFLPPDGTLSPLEHYYVRSGPALPGYPDSPVRARASVTAEQRMPLPFPLLPLELYAAAGWLADGFSEFSGDDFLAESGISLRLAMLEVILPLWVSSPPDGGDEWDLRWRIGLHPGGFPDLY